MNPMEQKKHTTRMKEIEDGVDVFVKATVKKLTSFEEDVKRVDKKIDDEHTHRLKLAGEQRSYVDQADMSTNVRVNTFIGRGFWSRLNWLLTGR